MSATERLNALGVPPNAGLIKTPQLGSAGPIGGTKNCSAVSRLAVVEFLACMFAIPLDSTHVRWLSEAVVAPLFTAVLGEHDGLGGPSYGSWPDENIRCARSYPFGVRQISCIRVRLSLN